MVVLRNEKRAALMARLGQIISLVGMGVLILGLLVIFLVDDNRVFLYQLVALAVGFILSQVGLYLNHRFGRKPRPDQILDTAVEKFARKDGRMYHFELPAEHVLLLPSAVLVFIAKYQGGNISVKGDAWKQSGIGFRGMLGQERLGNPSKDVVKALDKMTAFIASAAPAASDAPLIPIIVFTASNIGNLDTEHSTTPALYHTKLNGYLRQRKDLQKAMPAATYQALRQAFDAKAADVIPETVAAQEAK